VCHEVHKKWTTMVSYGTGTQQKTVSSPLTIHLSWCTGGRWFTVAGLLDEGYALEFGTHWWLIWYTGG
jgi:hypothetical protein